MSELSDIAAKVAKALGLYSTGGAYWSSLAHGNDRYKILAGDNLQHDGSNLFDPHWQVRCRDWLLERGVLSLAKGNLSFVDFGFGPAIVLYCPAAEFCARAIARILDTPSNKTPESHD